MKKLIKTMLSFVAVISAVTFSVISCGPEGPDDGGDGTDPGDGPTEEQMAYADSVENALYKQARAMQVVLTGESVQVSGCQATETEGLYEITLSTGASFTGYPGTDENRKTVLSYVQEEGTKYWATFDEQGVAAALKNEDGAPVTLNSTADFSIEEGKVVLELNEKHYPLGYAMEDALQVFDFELLADAQGTVYAVRFIFGEELTEVVYVSSYEGVYFYLPADEEKVKIAEIYVKVDGTATVAVAVSDGIEWKPLVAEGWNAHIRKVAGVSYVDITTGPQPTSTQNDVEQDGEENVGPQLQIVSPKGDFVFSSIGIVTEPFRSVFVSVSDAVIIPATGLGRFAYGISVYDEYDSEQMIAKAAGLIDGTIEPTVGCGVSEAAVQKPFAEILGATLDSEARYVLWALGDGVLKQIEFGEIAVNIDVVSTALLDAELGVEIVGATGMVGGVMEKSDDMIEAILYQVNNDIHEPRQISNKYDFTGKASEFTMMEGTRNELYPSTTYVVWVVPTVDGEYTYTENDIICKEFSTNPLTSGGTLELICSEATATASSLSFDLSCEGASMIYYAFLDAAGGLRYSSDEVDNDTKFKQITNAYNQNRIGDAYTVISDKTQALCKGLNDVASTEYWLYAVAVDSEGRYGKVHCVSAKTLELVYDESITLTVDAYNVTSKKATFKVTSAGGDLSDYIYWVGRATDPFYANSTHCGGTKTTAQKYMALNPDDESIAKAMSLYGPLAADGTITVEGMTMETEYVFVILEKGEQNFSKIGYKKIKTLAADLGVVVREGTPEWNAAKNTIGFDWHKDKFSQVPHLGAYYSFDFTCPKEYTAYIMCAGEGYYDELNFVKIEHFMIEIENYASRRVDKDHVPSDASGNYMLEPDYYKNGVHTEGQLMSVYDFYVHGAPLFGSVTYFAENSHKEGNCISWENGECANYKRAEEMIASYNNTLEPYTRRAEAFGLEGKEAADWALALKEAYSFYYKDAKPLIYINDGSPLYVVNASATGVNEDGVVPDRVYVMLKDLQGNYFEPMEFEVPNYFEK